MAGKLRSISEKIPWSLAVKSGILALALVYLPYWAYAALALLLYARSGSQALKLWTSCLALVILAGLPGWRYLDIFWWAFLSLHALAWVLIFGIKELLFVYRTQAYVVLISLVFFLASFYFFWQLEAANFRPASLVFFAGTAFLFAEFYGWLAVSRERRLLLSAASAFIFLELAWAISLLPIGFLSATALIFLAFSLFINSYLDYIEGRLSRRKISVNAAIFGAGALLIAAFSNWRI